MSIFETGSGVSNKGSTRERRKPYSSRMEAPPPVPVTQPSVQNLAQREGIRLAGWSGSSDWTSRSSLVLMVKMSWDFEPGWVRLQ